MFQRTSTHSTIYDDLCQAKPKLLIALFASSSFQARVLDGSSFRATMYIQLNKISSLNSREIAGMAKSPWKIENPSYGVVFQGHIGKPVWEAQVSTHVVGFVRIYKLSIRALLN